MKLQVKINQISQFLLITLYNANERVSATAVPRLT
jgi:hypothetical protein